jgi:ATP-dependent RNA helicase HelY
VVNEGRREGDERATVPRGPLGGAIDDVLDMWSDLERAEGSRGLQLTREPDLGFVWPIYRWARGESLAKVLASGVETDMSAGDFVRWARQVLDLLGQISEAAGPKSTIRRSARAAMDALNRGVLAYTSVN